MPATLALIPSDRCPTCGSETDNEIVHEPALIRHGGYGATRRTIVRYCDCGWVLCHEVTEVAP